jgi:hypothetical protein
MYLLLYNNILVFFGLIISYYASMTAPKLPKYIINLFNNTYIKILIVFIIAYKLCKNPFISLVVSVILLIILQITIMYENYKKKHPL